MVEQERRRWRVLVNLTERGRLVVVEARTRAEARRQARMGDWVESGDPESWVVRVVGAAEEER